MHCVTGLSLPRICSLSLQKNLFLRDGRKLRNECKPKNILAIDRFLSRGGGFFCHGADSTLEDVGLRSLVPTQYTRTAIKKNMTTELTCQPCVRSRKTSDFIYRYMVKSHGMVSQE